MSSIRIFSWSTRWCLAHRGPGGLGVVGLLTCSILLAAQHQLGMPLGGVLTLLAQHTARCCWSTLPGSCCLLRMGLPFSGGLYGLCWSALRLLLAPAASALGVTLVPMLLLAHGVCTDTLSSAALNCRNDTFHRHCLPRSCFSSTLLYLVLGFCRELHCRCRCRACTVIALWRGPYHCAKSAYQQQTACAPAHLLHCASRKHGHMLGPKAVTPPCTGAAAVLLPALLPVCVASVRTRGVFLGCLCCTAPTQALLSCKRIGMRSCAQVQLASSTCAAAVVWLGLGVGVACLKTRQQEQPRLWLSHCASSDLSQHHQNQPVGCYVEQSAHGMHPAACARWRAGSRRHCLYPLLSSWEGGPAVGCLALQLAVLCCLRVPWLVLIVNWTNPV